MNSFEYGFFDELEKLAAVFNGITFVGYNPKIEKSYQSGKAALRDSASAFLKDRGHSPDDIDTYFKEDFPKAVEKFDQVAGASYPGSNTAFVNLDPAFRRGRRETIAHEAFHAAHPILGTSESLARLVGGWNTHKKSTLSQRIRDATSALGDYVLHKPTYALYNPIRAKVLNALGFYKAFGRSDLQNIMKIRKRFRMNRQRKVRTEVLSPDEAKRTLDKFLSDIPR